MSVKVKLSDLMEGIDFQSDDVDVFLNTNTGEVVYIMEDLYAMVDEPSSDYPEWQQDEIAAAEEVMDEDYFLALPSSEDINEYRMMQQFIYQLKDETIQERLFEAIDGRGAFRRFNDQIFDFGIREDWFEYRENRLKELLIDWCQANNIELIDG